MNTTTRIVVVGMFLAALAKAFGQPVITNRVARLNIDPTFTKITAGSIVNDGGYGFGCAWGDYNNDGFIDLFVCNSYDDFGGQHDFLYRNNGDGTFTRITDDPVVNAGIQAFGATWGDYDNDGYLDLFVGGTLDGSTPAANRLYHNNGNGTFTKITDGLLVTQPLFSPGGVWADFDNDGLIDLFVVNFTMRGSGVAAQDNYLYRNTGDGTFDPISFGSKTLTNGDSFSAAAADLNNDGWIDIFVSQGGVRIGLQNSLLYTNNQAGTFTLLTNNVVFTNKANGVGSAWGDYDNDGFLDLFVPDAFAAQNNFLYHNNGDGTFTSVTNSPTTLDGGNSLGCAWGDYDNDGWLDLFVANLGTFDPNTLDSIAPEDNCLYHNNGDGTFNKISTGSPVNDLGYSTGCAWGDYDNDGFLDLFVSNGWVNRSENNFLYRNNGNSNNWITFRLVGTVSNRASIGAKVRLKATIGGNTFWQMREISGGTGYGSQNDMRPSFGLADATNVDLVQIEWPSGTVQQLTNVAARQFLTISEPPGLQAVGRCADNSFSLQLTSWPGLTFAIDTSSNLTGWTPWRIVTATNRITRIDTPCLQELSRFYRALPAD